MRIHSSQKIFNNVEHQANAAPFIFRANRDCLYSAADSESSQNFCQKIFAWIKNFLYSLCCPKTVQEEDAELATAEARAAREIEQGHREVAEAQQNLARVTLEQRQARVNNSINHLANMEQIHREHLRGMAQRETERFTIDETQRMETLRIELTHEVLAGQRRGLDPAQLDEWVANRKPNAIQRMNQHRDAALPIADGFRSEHLAFYQEQRARINELLQFTNQYPAEFPNREAIAARAAASMENCRQEHHALCENIKAELRNRYQGYIAEIENFTALNLIQYMRNRDQ